MPLWQASDKLACPLGPNLSCTPGLSPRLHHTGLLRQKSSLPSSVTHLTGTMTGAQWALMKYVLNTHADSKLCLDGKRYLKRIYCGCGIVKNQQSQGWRKSRDLMGLSHPEPACHSQTAGPVAHRTNPDPTSSTAGRFRGLCIH